MSTASDTDADRFPTIQRVALMLLTLRQYLAALWAEALSLYAAHGGAGGFRRAFAADTRGQTGNLVSLVIGVMIAAIVVMRVFIPVVNDAMANLSGTEKIIAGLLPLFGVLLVMISLASPLMRRT